MGEQYTQYADVYSPVDTYTQEVEIVTNETLSSNKSSPKGAKKMGLASPLDDDSFSACLLLKDDNDILNEWIAYHYHTLKLRAIVVATDPTSRTKPTVVLDRWKPFLEIDVWTDDLYMPDYFIKGDYDTAPSMLGLGNSSTSSNMDIPLRQAFDIHNVPEIERQELRETNNHRFRQLTFYNACIKNLKKRSKTWMMHIDSDEYIALNHMFKNRKSWHSSPVPNIKTPSSLLRFLKSAAKYHRHDIR